MLSDRNLKFKKMYENNISYNYKKEENLFCVYTVDVMTELNKKTKFSTKDRKKNFFDKIENENQRIEIKKFFDAWITYLDEKEHTMARKIVIKFLQHNINSVLNKRINEVYDALREMFNCKEEFNMSDKIEVATIKILSVVFNVQYVVMKDFIKDARYITEFAFNENPTFDMCSVVIEKMRNSKTFVKNEKSLNFLKDKIVKNDSEDGYALVVNALVTAFTPIRSIIASSIRELLENKSLLNVDKKVLVNELIRLNSPFNYVARQNVESFIYNDETIDKNTRFEFYLPSFNIDPNKFKLPYEFSKYNTKPNYSFGIDSYFCPGAGVAKNVLSVLIDVINENNNFDIISYGVEDTYSVHLLKDMIIKKSN